MKRKMVIQQLQQLQPMLDLLDFSLKEPEEHSLEKDLDYASLWLAGIIEDFLPQFLTIYNQHHTGETFWQTAKYCGLHSEDDILSDLQICKDMRRLLLPVRRRLVKRLPIQFGGTYNATPKDKTTTRSEDTEGDNLSVESEGLASPNPQRKRTQRRVS